MKIKHQRSRLKGIGSKRTGRESGFEEEVTRLAESQRLPDEFLKMLNEVGLGIHKDDCNGNCITCKKKVSCETYKKIKDCFTG